MHSSEDLIASLFDSVETDTRNHSPATPEPPLIESAGTRLRARLHLEVANLKEATEVIVRNHYLHRGRTMAQIAYWITLDQRRCGVLLFALPRMSVPFRGVSPMSLVELARMWISPDVQGSRVVDSDGKEHAFSVATCAVGASLRKIAFDWHGKYPHLPLLEACVSWADDVHHEGTIYRAANFTEVGKSGGSLHGNTSRPNGGRDQLNPDYLHPKTAFFYPFRRSLTSSEQARAEREWEALRPKRSKLRLRDPRQGTLGDQLPQV